MTDSGVYRLPPRSKKKEMWIRNYSSFFFLFWCVSYIIIVQLGTISSRKIKTLGLDHFRTTHPPPKTFKEVPGQLEAISFVWVIS